jgi:hypothetical protein
MQNENLFLFSFPRWSNFSEAKIRAKSRGMQNENLFLFSFPRWSNFSEAKIRTKSKECKIAIPKNQKLSMIEKRTPFLLTLACSL